MELTEVHYIPPLLYFIYFLLRNIIYDGNFDKKTIASTAPSFFSMYCLHQLSL